MKIHVKALTGNIITLDVSVSNTIQEVLDMVQAADVVTQRQNIALNILSTGVVHGGWRLVSEDTGLEYHSDESCDVAAMLDGNCCKVVLKKLFNDTLDADDMLVVTVLRNEYKADLKITHVFSNHRAMREVVGTHTPKHMCSIIIQIPKGKLKSLIMSSLYNSQKKSSIKTSSN